ncbi:MAG: SDR family oxidoreductase [Chitinophagales bacterium]|nr:SDR family oxidoreductase [Bacteroidota bacterium]MCB9043834.1 SDR family oxidoreductase [Chitinophagales bacterium]
MSQHHKTIVVSGATKGIGRAIAEHFAAQGFNVAVCARNTQALAAMQKSFSEKFPQQKFLFFPADVADKAQVLAFAEAVKNTFGSVSVLVNNAGVFIPGQIHTEDSGIFEQQMHTNLFSAYYLTRALLPALQSSTAEKRHIFNICSTASLVAYPNGGSYCISKFALLGFSKVLRVEMQPYKIAVSSVLPGATLTASWEGTTLPPERFMQSAHIAEAVWAAYSLAPQTIIEEILLRPMSGDIA